MIHSSATAGKVDKQWGGAASPACSDAAAFDAHLKTGHVHAFISAVPALSLGGPGSLIQLNEIPIPDSDPEATAAPGWSTE